MLDKSTIPVHTRCNNCGDCCGPIMLTYKEEKEIVKFLKGKQYLLNRLKKQFRPVLTCQFRDMENKCCAIYEVRPVVCRLFGVAEGLMTCSRGNSANINGHLYIDFNDKPKSIKKFY